MLIITEALTVALTSFSLEKMFLQPKLGGFFVYLFQF